MKMVCFGLLEVVISSRLELQKTGGELVRALLPCQRPSSPTSESRTAPPPMISPPHPQRQQASPPRVPSTRSQCPALTYGPDFLARHLAFASAASADFSPSPWHFSPKAAPSRKLVRRANDPSFFPVPRSPLRIVTHAVLTLRIRLRHPFQRRNPHPPSIHSPQQQPWPT